MTRNSYLINTMFFEPESASRQQDHQSNIQVVNDPLSLIYNEAQWHVSRVSPLYNLNYETVKLKQYATKICQSLARAGTANSTVTYTVQVEHLPLVKFSENDPDGIMIIVNSQENSKIAYLCILLSWGMSDIVPEATHLPYLLERGKPMISTIVKDTLQTIFDCNIKELNFTQHQILQFGFNFIENDTSKYSDNFVLTYASQTNFKDKLELAFEIGDIHVIWKGVKKEATEKIQQINLSYKMLQSQIYFMVKVDVTALDLCEIWLPKASVNKNGTIRMLTPEMVNTVFNVLNDICRK